MDNFARNYLIGFIIVVVTVVAWIFLSRDDRVLEINEVLANDFALQGYPYIFEVQQLDNGVAVVGSPRSAQVPVMRFLRTAFPSLRNTPVDHPDMMAAQSTLAKKQSRAQELILSQPDVQRLRWEFDERWFNEHGVFANLQP